MKEDITMSKTIWKVLFYVIGIAGIGFIIYSMVKDQITPYLGVGTCCTAIANVIGCKLNLKRYNPCRKRFSQEDD